MWGLQLPPQTKPATDSDTFHRFYKKGEKSISFSKQCLFLKEWWCCHPGFLKKVVMLLCGSFKPMWQMGAGFRDYFLPRNFLLASGGIQEEGPNQQPCLAVVEEW